MKILLFLLLFLIPPLLQAEVFRWVDKDGNVHFSDQQQKGSERIELKPATIIGTRINPPAQPQEVNRQPGQDTKALYDSIKIATPANDESIRSNAGLVNVMIESNPGLANGDSYRLTMNGEVIENNITTGLIPLENVDRGSHTLSVEIIDKSGNSLLSSEEITFHVLRTASPPPRPAPR